MPSLNSLHYHNISPYPHHCLQPILNIATQVALCYTRSLLEYVVANPIIVSPGSFPATVPLTPSATATLTLGKASSHCKAFAVPATLNSRTLSPAAGKACSLRCLLSNHLLYSTSYGHKCPCYALFLWPLLFFFSSHSTYFFWQTTLRGLLKTEFSRPERNHYITHQPMPTT